MNNFKKFNFRKISAYDPEFIELREKNKGFLKSYFNYNYMNSLYKGSINSGKAHSYENYLIRLAVFIFEKYGISDMTDLIFFNALFEIRYEEKFKEYNLSENRFPNACINEYFKYWAFLESQKDTQNFEDTLLGDEELELIDQPVKKKIIDSEAIKLSDQVVRNNILSLKVKEESDWKCQWDKNHLTFTSFYNNKPYVEAHHLIPLSYQWNYEYSLDIPSNLIILCPNCHRKIHFGIEKDKRIMLDGLYKDRKLRLQTSGINLDLDLLYVYYGIPLF